jgi:superfamily II DNA helicase RecQ
MDSHTFDFPSLQNRYSKAVENLPNFEGQFKIEQARVIFEILRKSDTLSLMPTSFGKTLCMIAPSIMEVVVNILRLVTI